MDRNLQSSKLVLSRLSSLPISEARFATVRNPNGNDEEMYDSTLKAKFIG